MEHESDASDAVPCCGREQWKVFADKALQKLKTIETLSEKDAKHWLGIALQQRLAEAGMSRGGQTYYLEHNHHYFGCNQCGSDTQFLQNDDECREYLLKPVEVIRKESKCFVKKIFSTWRDLNNVLAHHEELIRKRWQKKTRNQRKAVLLTAWPNMAASHRPDFEPVSTELCPHMHIRETGSRHDIYAFPYINLEDLLVPKSLLILLNSRGRNLPDTFAHSDLELAPFWKLRPEMLAERSTTSTMSFAGRTNEAEYGVFIEWSDQAQATKSITRGHTLHPNHGYQVLLIQYRVLKFLNYCCSLILHDISDEERYPRAEIVPQPEPSQLSDNHDSYKSIEVLARESPYRVPARLDLVRLRNLISACRDSAADHIWTLREDPGYFADVVLDAKGHRIEGLIKGCCGLKHALSQDDILTRTLRDMIVNAYLEFYDWDQVEQRISRLLQLSDKYSNDIDPSRALPDGYFQALVETRFYLEAFMLDFIAEFDRAWPGSPPIQKYFVTDCDNNYCCDPYDLTATRSDVPWDDETERVMQMFNFLRKHKYRQFLTVHNLMEVMDRMLQSNPLAKTLITTFVTSIMSRLSVISECLHHIHLFQPWAQQIESAVCERRSELLAQHILERDAWRPILDTSFANSRIAKLGSPSQARFKYPVHKRDSRDKIETLRASEAALDSFWSAVDQRFRDKAGKTPHDIVRDALGERPLLRTPPWVGFIDTLFSGSAQDRQSSEDPCDILFQDRHDATKQVTGAFPKLSVSNKAKHKTRGIPAPQTSPLQELENLQTPSSQPIYRLDRRAYKVFKTLFHDPSSPGRPAGEIPWADFLHAMVSVGFSAEKLQGSAWQLVSTNLDVERPIQIHEPHPSNKLPFTWSRRFGRRLARAYGWESAMFRLA